MILDIVFPHQKLTLVRGENVCGVLPAIPVRKKMQERFCMITF